MQPWIMNTVPCQLNPAPVGLGVYYCPNLIDEGSLSVYKTLKPVCPSTLHNKMVLVDVNKGTTVGEITPRKSET